MKKEYKQKLNRSLKGLLTRTVTGFFFVLLMLVLISFAYAHGGRTNSEGCHNNRKTGDYHCHESKKKRFVPKRIPTPSLATGETWRGLVIAPEKRCSDYNSRDYSYSQSVEPRIVAQLGNIYGPYTGRCFTSIRETDIEHIVARSEAHDSGLCAADRATRKRFAKDLLNLTLAAPDLNRNEKKHYDATEWMPKLNKCWFANRIVEVRKKYGLTIDRREANALEQILSSCISTEMIFHPCGTEAQKSADSPVSKKTDPGSEGAKSSDL